MAIVINHILIRSSASIKRAIKKINFSKSKALIVLDAKEKFLGTITDGDIRRAILKNYKLDNSIEPIYQKNSFFLKNNYSRGDFKKLSEKKELRIIPVLNNSQKVLKVIDLSNKNLDKKISIIKDKNIEVIIMAGGEGKRMQPYTYVIPKPLLPIEKKPMIEHVLDFFKNNGLKSFVVSLNYKNKLLKLYFKNLKKYKNIKFIEEKKSLGTVGSLSMLKKNKSKNYLISNCDMKFNFKLKDLIDTHSKNKNDATIVVSLKEETIPYGVFITNNDGKVIEMLEKPKHSSMINLGLYLFNGKVINLIEKNRYTDINEIILKILNNNKYKVELYPVHEDNWTDMSLFYKN